MERLLELTDIEIRMGFAASCVETAAKQVGCTYKEMYRRMKRVGLIDKYILRHYDTIHTETFLKAWTTGKPAKVSPPPKGLIFIC